MTEEIKTDCPCKRLKCERHGKCKECCEHHRNDKGTLTACERIKIKEDKKSKR